MKITRHTAGNLSLQRISIAITLVYSIILSEEMQVSAPIFFDFLCKFFVNNKMGNTFYTFYISSPIFPAMFFPEIPCFFCFASNQPAPGDFFERFSQKRLVFYWLVCYNEDTSQRRESIFPKGIAVSLLAILLFTKFLKRSSTHEIWLF